MPKKTQYLHDLLHTKLKALYDVETQLLKALPKMAKAATDKSLATAFKEHLAETKVHVKRLEQVFKHLEKKPQKLKSEAIRGLIADGEWVIKNVSGPEALDANLIAAASYVEHYEIAGYIAAAEWANMLELDEVSTLLIETLDEEVAADEKLFSIGSSGVFDNAMEVEE